jgi:hypothetical protein
MIEKENPKSPGWLKCIEYSCLLDIVFKVLTIIANNHPLINTVTRFKSPKCGELFSLDFYVMIGIKLISIFVMLSGIHACVKQDLYDFNRFVYFFNIYVLIEALSIFGISLETVFSTCAKMKLKKRLMIAGSMFFVGILLLAIYYGIWSCFQDRALHYLQTKDNRDYRDELKTTQRKDYETFGREEEMNKLKGQDKRKFDISPEKVPVKDSLVEFHNAGAGARLQEYSGIDNSSEQIL